MPEHDEVRWVRGPVASSIVANDPFWSTVRRRDPDLTIALLPPEEGEAPPASTPEDHPVLGDPDEHAAAVLAATGATWSSYVDAEPTTEDHRWVPGPVRSAVRREVTLARDDVDEVAAARALRLAADALRGEGWHVLVPDTGMPRVLAGRGDGDRREELQLVRAPGRLVLRVRTAPLRTADEGTARDLVVAR